MPSENLKRPLAIGRKNWLFVSSEKAGQRAAAVMSLIQSAKLNGHEPHAYLKDVLTRLPTHKAKDIVEPTPQLATKRNILNGQRIMPRQLI